jgi:hypothetical protein
MWGVMINFTSDFEATCTARTARFSKKSPWSVFFRCEMSVICPKITVKCRWNHGETFTAKIYKLGPKCRWNILIVCDNTAAKIIRVYTYMWQHFMCSFVFCCLVFFFLFRTLYFNLIPVFFQGCQHFIYRIYEAEHASCFAYII